MTKSNEYLIASTTPGRYRIFDSRSRKPIYYKKQDGSGGAVVEELDYIKIDNNKQKIMYLPPNPIAIQLSIVKFCINEAKNLDVNKTIKERSDKILKEKVHGDTKDIYNHISLVQQAIVFSYTALETFSNLSIPNDYEYTKTNNKNIKETYNKESIERWISLKEKLSRILVEVYGTESITKKKFWNHFLDLEAYRHDIIHQKSVNYSSFYRKYFKNSIYHKLNVAEEIIKFFYEEVEKRDTTNPIWPWISSDKNSMPMNYGAESFFSNSKIIGNLYEGKKK
ncbi:hypothetical protein [Salinicoccus roseus]|uniref:hypothetical protein n=1 Tax=Salinicoccus roseus TaxID=45670 RepID=UPI002301B96B|nr:hypothetical protein [Salinicoccus roseus]